MKAAMQRDYRGSRRPRYSVRFIMTIRIPPAYSARSNVSEAELMQ